MKNHRLALSPADTVDGLDLVIDNIGGDQTIRFLLLIVVEGHLSIDIQSGGSTAWRPHTGLMSESIAKGEGVFVLSLPGRLQGCLLTGETGEPVLGLLFGSDSFLEIGVARVVGLVQGVLVSVGVVELDVDVAVLALLDEGYTGTDGCDIAVEGEGDCLVVVALADGDCSCLATATGVVDSLDVNLVGVDVIIRSGCWRCDAEDGKEAKNECRDGVLHSEGLRKLRGDKSYDLGASVRRRTASVLKEGVVDLEIGWLGEE